MLRRIKNNDVTITYGLHDFMGWFWEKRIVDPLTGKEVIVEKLSEIDNNLGTERLEERMASEGIWDEEVFR